MAVKACAGRWTVMTCFYLFIYFIETGFSLSSKHGEDPGYFFFRAHAKLHAVKRVPELDAPGLGFVVQISLKLHKSTLFFLVILFELSS